MAIGMLKRRWEGSGGMLLKRLLEGMLLKRLLEGMLLKRCWEGGGGMFKQGSNSSSNWEGKLKRCNREWMEQVERWERSRMERMLLKRWEGGGGGGMLLKRLLEGMLLLKRCWEGGGGGMFKRLEGMLQGLTRPPAHSDGTPRRLVSRYLSLFFPLNEGVHTTDDVAERVYKISALFKVPVDRYHWMTYTDLPPGDFEVWLDEFKGYVESMDMAQELHSIDCLVPLFHHVLYHPPASIRAKAAEIIAIMVQNNPSSQQLVMEVNGLQPLLYNFISDPDATSRTKALGAISSLIRNNKPGITAFRLENGYATLKDALRSESVTLQREALNLIQYLLHENSSDCNIVTELRFSPIMMHLTSSDDAKVREAALRSLIVLAKDEGGNNGQLVKYVDKVKNLLQGRRQVPQEHIEGMIEGISAMAPEDLSAAREERQLMDSL